MVVVGDVYKFIRKENIMGYESRLYIISKRKESNFGDVVAMMDMCKMGDNDFFDLFTYPIDFDAYHDDGNTPIKEDSYGNICSYAYLKDVLEWLEPYYKRLKRADGKYGVYRRIRPLYKFLKSFNNPQWVNNNNDILVLHYGY